MSGRMPRSYSVIKPSKLRTSSVPELPVPFANIFFLPSRRPSFSTPVPHNQPPVPPAWEWTCHKCGRRYPLGVTRRCLNDGHYFCAGTTFHRPTGRWRRHRACGSAFDYAGWKAYGAWRTEVTRLAEPSGILAATALNPEELGLTSQKFSVEEGLSATASNESNCERHCSFPSECRWISRSSSASTEQNSECATPVDAIEEALISLEEKVQAGTESTDVADTNTVTGNEAEDALQAPVIDFAAFKAGLDKVRHVIRARRSGRESAGSRTSAPLEIDLGKVALANLGSITLKDDSEGMKGFDFIVRDEDKEMATTCVDAACMLTMSSLQKTKEDEVSWHMDWQPE